LTENEKDEEDLRKKIAKKLKQLTPKQRGELEELAKRLPTREIKHPSEIRFPEDALTSIFVEELRRVPNDLRINVFINILVVGIGCVLLVYSMAYSWVEGVNLFSAAFGSLGVVYFIALFYFRPQKGIAKAIGAMAQLQTLYQTYVIQVETISAWELNNPEKTLDQVERITKLLEEFTNNMCEKIQLVKE